MVSAAYLPVAAAAPRELASLDSGPTFEVGLLSLNFEPVMALISRNLNSLLGRSDRLWRLSRSTEP